MKNLRKEIAKFESTIDTSDIAESMLSLNYKFLGEYYDEIRRQGQKSFIITLIVTVLSFGVTVSGICGVLFFGLKVEGYISIAAGILSDFISLIFFYLYNRTSKEMKDYFYRMLLSQNLAVSFALVKTLPSDKRAEEVTKIIDALMHDFNKYLVIETGISQNEK